ncbi:MAG: peptide deformylase [Thermomicrobiales bacterium]|nr:peptide deformylase [Thermomicrobiales bacterium]
MALMDIVLEGDPRLRQPAAEITRIDKRLVKLAEDMFETMLAAPGVGLAGPQVGVMERIIVVHVPGDYIGEGEEDISYTLINPEIIAHTDEIEVATEGCLSIPEFIGDVPRWTEIQIKATELDGQTYIIEEYDWVARVLQHEIDHLNGIMFTDRVVDKSTIRPANEPQESNPETSEAS